jgi:hypothetical protein
MGIKKNKKEKTYLVRAEEVKTVYGVSIIKVKALNKNEAIQKVLTDDIIEVVDSWDNCTEDINYINTDQWDVEKNK